MWCAGVFFSFTFWCWIYYNLFVENYVEQTCIIGEWIDREIIDLPLYVTPALFFGSVRLVVYNRGKFDYNQVISYSRECYICGFPEHSRTIIERGMLIVEPNLWFYRIF